MVYLSCIVLVEKQTKLYLKKNTTNNTDFTVRVPLNLNLNSLNIIQAAGVGFECRRIANHLVQRDHEENEVELRTEDKRSQVKCVVNFTVLSKNIGAKQTWREKKYFWFYCAISKMERGIILADSKANTIITNETGPMKLQMK